MNDSLILALALGLFIAAAGLILFVRHGLRQAERAARWIVARDGGRDCERCEQEIRRGEAYEYVPGGGPDDLRHIHCPAGGNR